MCPKLTEVFRDDTRFVTLMLANNETGAIQPVSDLTALARERGIPVHTDAVQAVGRIPVSFHDLGVTTLAASAHKFHGPSRNWRCSWFATAFGSAHGFLVAGSSKVDDQGRLQFPW